MQFWEDFQRYWMGNMRLPVVRFVRRLFHPVQQGVLNHLNLSGPEHHRGFQSQHLRR